MFKMNFHFQERKSENSVKIHFLKRINLHDFGCCPAQPVLFTHCQKRDFGLKNRSVLSKILIGFSENPLELGEIGGDSRTRIFAAFSTQMGVQSLENTAFSGFSHLPLSSVKFRQVRFWQLDSKCSCPQGHVGSNPTASTRLSLDALRILRFGFSFTFSPTMVQNPIMAFDRPSFWVTSLHTLETRDIFAFP